MEIYQDSIELDDTLNLKTDNHFWSSDKEFHDACIEDESRLKTLAIKLTKNPTIAEDLVQRTLLRAIKTSKRCDTLNLQGWLSTIMLNLFRKDYRSNHDKNLVLVEDWKIDKLNSSLKMDTEKYVFAGDPLNYVDLCEYVKKYCCDETYEAFMKLKKESAVILGLIIFFEYQYEQVAETLNMKKGTVQSRFARAKEVLKNPLSKNNY